MIRISRDVLDPEEITSTVRAPDKGGVVTFLGTVRNHTGGKRVLYLEYEAYEEMAEKMLARIAGEVIERWDDTVVSIAHRLGRMETGEISMVVAAASPHRAEAFSACQYVVNRIKENVPIWKKEAFEGGEVWVGMEGQSASGSS